MSRSQRSAAGDGWLRTGWRWLRRQRHVLLAWAAAAVVAAGTRPTIDEWIALQFMVPLYEPTGVAAQNRPGPDVFLLHLPKDGVDLDSALLGSGLQPNTYLGQRCQALPGARTGDLCDAAWWAVCRALHGSTAMRETTWSDSDFSANIPKRALFAAALLRLAERGARVVAFDAAFPAPRLTPQPSDEALLAAAIAVSTPNAPSSCQPQGPVRVIIGLVEGGSGSSLFGEANLILRHDFVWHASLAARHADFAGVVRSMDYADSLPDDPSTPTWPALAVLTAFAADHTAAPAQPAVADVLKEYGATSASSQLWLHYRRPGPPGDVLPLTGAIEGTSSYLATKNDTVIVGVATNEDVHGVPRLDATSTGEAGRERGAVVHAHAVAQLRRRDLERGGGIDSTPGSLEWYLGLLFAFAVAALIAQTMSMARAKTVVGFGLVTAVGAVAVAALLRVPLPAVGVIAALMAPLSALMLPRWRIEREAQRLRAAAESLEAEAIPRVNLGGAGRQGAPRLVQLALVSEWSRIGRPCASDTELQAMIGDACKVFVECGPGQVFLQRAPLEALAQGWLDVTMPSPPALPQELFQAPAQLQLWEQWRQSVQTQAAAAALRPTPCLQQADLLRESHVIARLRRMRNLHAHGATVVGQGAAGLATEAERELHAAAETQVGSILIAKQFMILQRLASYCDDLTSQLRDQEATADLRRAR